ncbi:hypothetical protein CAE01nite_09360 [Cellulomonas aerilata]|uniref:Pyrrolo-quinoline quinone repeat domain-containing protein n=2 Tax=Cellulomonas aerilata TaxID=515326 RepID=A0A512D9S7_9CELL|nr:hypothetical protein CAE01nite_09360 [Cellulomonas aerilata]
MQDVELVEAVDDAGTRATTSPSERLRVAPDTPDALDTPEGPDDPDAPPTTHRTTPSPAARARLRRAVAVLVAVVLAVAATSSLVQSRRDAARLRALADVPGVMAPLSGPVTELWRTDGWPVAPPSEVGGLLVTVLATPSPGLEAVGIEPRTGEVVWRTTLRARAPEEVPAECVVPGAPWPADGAATDAADTAPGDRPVLVCVVADEVATATEGRNLDSFVHPVRSRLVVMDAVSGELLADDPVGSPAGVASAGTDLLLGTVDADGRPRVTRSDPRSGEVHWTFTSPEPVPADQFGLRRIALRSQDGVVVADAGPVWVLSADGEVLRALPGTVDPFDGHTTVVAGGRFLARTTLGSTDVTTELVEVATGRSQTVEGFVDGSVPDDRSLPDVVLVSPVQGGGLQAHDVGTGAPRWTLEGHDTSPPMILDERVVSIDGSRVESVDGVSGAVVWSTEVAGLAASAMVTDGEVVIVTTNSATDGTLVAVDLDDGRQVWSAPLDDQHYLFVHERRLFGYGSTGLIAIG